MVSTSPPSVTVGPSHAPRRTWSRSRPRLHGTLAREHAGTYDAAASADAEASYTRTIGGNAPDTPNGSEGAADASSGVLRDAVAEMGRAAARVGELVADPRTSSGQLEGLLAMSSTLPHTERRSLVGPCP